MTDILRKMSLGRTVCTGLTTEGHRGWAAICKPKLEDPQHKPILLTPWGLGLQMSRIMGKQFSVVEVTETAIFFQGNHTRYTDNCKVIK